MTRSRWKLTVTADSTLTDYCLVSTNIDPDHEFLRCLTWSLSNVRSLTLGSSRPPPPTTFVEDLVVVLSPKG